MRPEKASIVSDLSEKINRSPFMLVTDYQKMKVTQFGELRNRLSPAGAEVRVVKNSFLKRAMAESGYPDVSDQLTGQTAVVLGENDVAPVAKILKTFAAEFKIAALKVGVVDKVILSTKDVEALAELPSREVLLSQLLGLAHAAGDEPGARVERARDCVCAFAESEGGSRRRRRSQRSGAGCARARSRCARGGGKCSGCRSECSSRGDCPHPNHLRRPPKQHLLRSRAKNPQPEKPRPNQFRRATHVRGEQQNNCPS